MNEPQPVAIENFSHVCIGVSDMEKSLAFYTAVLGMDVVFDVELGGAGLDAVTGGAAQNGRMIGGLIGGAMVELLFLGELPPVLLDRALAIPTYLFALPTWTTHTKPFGISIPRCILTPRLTSVVCECSSSTIPMARPSKYSSCPQARTPRWSFGDLRRQSARPAERDCRAREVSRCRPKTNGHFPFRLHPARCRRSLTIGQDVTWPVRTVGRPR